MTDQEMKSDPPAADTANQAAEEAPARPAVGPAMAAEEASTSDAEGQPKVGKCKGRATEAEAPPSKTDEDKEEDEDDATGEPKEVKAKEHKLTQTDLEVGYLMWRCVKPGEKEKNGAQKIDLDKFQALSKYTRRSCTSKISVMRRMIREMEALNDPTYSGLDKPDKGEGSKTPSKRRAKPSASSAKTTTPGGKRKAPAASSPNEPDADADTPTPKRVRATPAKKTPKTPKTVAASDDESSAGEPATPAPKGKSAAIPCKTKADTGGSSPAVATPKGRGRKKAVANNDDDDTAGQETGGPAAGSATPKGRGRKKAAANNDDTAGQETAGPAIPKGRGRKKAATNNDDTAGQETAGPPAAKGAENLGPDLAGDDKDFVF